MLKRNYKVLIKGGGDLATGIACRLFECGFSVLITEIEKPTTIRRTVAFSEAVYKKSASVEDIVAVLCSDIIECETALKNGNIPLIIDSTAAIKNLWQPDIIVDAILAKKNLGLAISDAPLTIGIGPGFFAQKDCHCVIESQRGHNLGRCIYYGSAEANTGVPGDIGGHSLERLLKSPSAGIFHSKLSIGDYVKKGEIVAYVDNSPVVAAIDGILRGLLMNDLKVDYNMKIGDIDPRSEKEHCYSVSDKARSIGGGVLEAILKLGRNIF